MLDTGVKTTWNPNASDMELIASLKDIIEAMAEATETPIKWKGVQHKSEEERRETLAKAERDNTRRSLKGETVRPALHILCNTDEALNDARVLQTETAMTLGKMVSTNGAPVDVDDVDAVAVLLTKNVLYDPGVLVQMYKGIVANLPLVPVCLIGRGYDYASASIHLADLAPGLGADKYAELADRLEKELDSEGKPATVEALQTAIAGTLPRIIAVNWEPEAGKNQLDATVNNVVSRVKTVELKPVPALKLGGILSATRKLSSARKGSSTDRSGTSDPLSSAKTPTSAKATTTAERRPSRALVPPSMLPRPFSRCSWSKEPASARRSARKRSMSEEMGLPTEGATKLFGKDVENGEAAPAPEPTEDTLTLATYRDGGPETSRDEPTYSVVLPASKKPQLPPALDDFGASSLDRVEGPKA